MILYSPGGRVTSRLDLRDNRKVITDYRNHGIIRILTDLVIFSVYFPGVLRERRAAPCSARLRIVGWVTSEGAAHVVCHGYPGSYPPQLVPERLVSTVQCHLKLIRAGVNKAELLNS